ncbi:MAG TPA: hypothetical protein VFM37_12000 [Pseudonocardiaceae bacterium]|nr:hypothetical protein [Pseudonocardiaceae bacterium]
MLTHPLFPDHPLVEPMDLTSGRLPAHLADAEPVLRATLDWARRYLCQPHPELGRKGNVCPFVETALHRNTFFMAVYRGRPDPTHMRDLLTLYRTWFADLEPRTGRSAQFKTILVLFPDVPDTELQHVIDGTQRALKTDYVAGGLMIGEFHAGPPDKPGLWNDRFRPLASPIPLLAIRHMVPSDFPFLRSDREHLRSYLERFGGDLPGYLQDTVTATAARHGLLVPAPAEPDHPGEPAQPAEAR